MAHIRPFRFPVAQSKGEYYCCDCNKCWSGGFPGASTLSVTLSGFTALNYTCALSCNCIPGGPTGYTETITADYTGLNGTFVADAAPQGSSVLTACHGAICSWYSSQLITIPAGYSWPSPCAQCGALTVDETYQVPVVVAGCLVKLAGCNFQYNAGVFLNVPSICNIGGATVSQNVSKCSPQTLTTTFVSNECLFLANPGGATCGPYARTPTITAKFQFSA